MEKREVIVKGLDIPFWDLVLFLVKLSLASIPAIFIIYFVIWIAGTILGAFIFPSL